MYAVIFRAEVAIMDDTYLEMARRMRELAIEEYGCLEFTSVTEGSQEIAISYWPSKEHIRAWRNNSEHILAQQMGQSRWYRQYQVQVMKLEREYRFPLS